LAAPEFEQYEEVTRWKYKGEVRPDKRKPERPRWIDRDFVGVGFAEVVRALAWLALAVAIVLVVWRISSWRASADKSQERAAPLAPAPRQGKAKADEVLPRDIVLAVQQMLAAGRVRDALGLLYRAAAARLGARASDTEADCLARARSREQATRAYVTSLVRAWQRAAYAHEASLDAAHALLQEWPQHFPDAQPGPPPAARAGRT
jgi:hypothetical protein